MDHHFGTETPQQLLDVVTVDHKKDPNVRQMQAWLKKKTNKQKKQVFITKPESKIQMQATTRKTTNWRAKENPRKLQSNTNQRATENKTGTQRTHKDQETDKLMENTD